MRFPRSVLFLVACTTLSAATIYDLKADWSDTNNPNGPWAFWQGSTLLPHQGSNLGLVCCGFAFSGWAPGATPGNFLPWWNQMPPTSVIPDELPGDVGTHSVDPYNGNPALGESRVTWTAPVAGTIDITGGVWYGQVPDPRSNDYILKLSSTVLASGTVSLANGRTRNNPSTFNLTGLPVNAGQIVELTVKRSPGYSAGSWSGVNLTITLVPEPATCTLLLSGLAALAFRVHRPRRTT